MIHRLERDSLCLIMKSSDVRKLMKAYQPLFTAQWKFNRREFVRPSEHWVQTVSLNIAQHRAEYVPRSACDFLMMPGPVTGAWLGCELKTKPHGAQWWVTLREHESRIEEVMSEMAEQFFPTLADEIDEDAIEFRLASQLSYWPNSYALCVMACSRQNSTEAGRFFRCFLDAISDKPYAWAGERTKELQTVLELADEKSRLQEHLSKIKADRIAQFKALAT